MTGACPILTRWLSSGIWAHSPSYIIPITDSASYQPDRFRPARSLRRHASTKASATRPCATHAGRMQAMHYAGYAAAPSDLHRSSGVATYSASALTLSDATACSCAFNHAAGYISAASRSGDFGERAGSHLSVDTFTRIDVQCNHRLATYRFVHTDKCMILRYLGVTFQSGCRATAPFG